jgi:hypothetical protein
MISARAYQRLAAEDHMDARWARRQIGKFWGYWQ